MFLVYIIYSSKFDRYYIGMTENVNRRLLEHNNGKNISTKAFVPWDIVNIETFDSRFAARVREKYLKSAAGRRWRKLNIRPRARPNVPYRTGGAQNKTMFLVYIIYSSKFDRYYVGMTENVNRRLLEHNSGKNISTKAFVPWDIVNIETFDSRFAARVREKYLKSTAGRRWRKLNIRPRGATE
ncbi:GIY-YIG nuclease family protein [Gillisia sp. JM1]|uniref:GIY-YIG nuclease family protein n=1 Tax=Gillisia sp. JM1 TaxID=1283286 RepID=UPI001E60C5A0|nr:GIY-YIG nuclease family protein [Gillisia sp. JM1]